MAEWSFVLGGAAPAGVETRQLSAASGRVLTWRVDAPASAQFSIDGRSSEAAEVTQFATDLTAYRDGTKLFRGRIGPEADDITPSAHRCQFSAVDYRAMFTGHRIIGAAGRTFAAVDQGLIAWTLIQESQALSGGNWAVTNGIGPTNGTVRDRTYDPGKSVGEAIGELGRVDGGFEWEIDAALALNRWYPKRGAANGIVLDFGGLLARVRRNLTPDDFGNHWLVTGTDGLAPATATSATIATDPPGRFEKFAGYPSIQEATTLTGRASWLLAYGQTIRPEWTATLVTNRWEGPTSVWIGDTITLAVASGRLAVATLYRIVELTVSIGKDGDETVTLGLVLA